MMMMGRKGTIVAVVPCPTTPALASAVSPCTIDPLA
jgi:hypothetical protein